MVHPGTERTPIISAQRILPLPKHVREGAIKFFFPKHLQEQTLQDRKNHDCLMRIYLGQRYGEGQARGDYSLRNFPISIDRIEKLGSDKKQLATSIAQGRATLHWGARTNARDVEFVLGVAPENAINSQEEPEPRKAVSIFVFDFDQSQTLPFTKAGCLEAANAFWDNDPYFPRPFSNLPIDSNLWGLFIEQYLNFSEIIMNDSQGKDSEARKLPGIFIDKVIDLGRGGRASRMAVTDGPKKGETPVSTAVKSTPKKGKGRREYPELKTVA